MLLPLLLLMSDPVAQPQPPATETCEYDLDAMLELDLDSFDQDLNGGWRPLAGQGCKREAAELIREWRHEKRAHDSILYWHEGQLRANVGETEAAIALFNLTYKPAELDVEFGWNHYVSGSIAFLERERDALQNSIAELRKVPEPEDNNFTMADGTVLKIDWPPNLNVLEAFERCWDKPYAEAYSSAECRVKKNSES